MEIARKSFFKNPEADKQWFENWVAELEGLNRKKYERIEVQTALGKTHVWALNSDKKFLKTLVIFPGARTTALFWDFDNCLQPLEKDFRIFLVETNGLPNLSDGNTPEIKSKGFGEWASEVFKKLDIKKAYIAGASFGGLICMKLCITAPEKVEAAFLLNAGCLQPFSLTFKNLYYNLLPIISPTAKNISKFLDAAVFCKPHHALPPQFEKLLIDYEVFALTRYKDNTQKPYFMGDELLKVTTPVILIQGDKDLLFPVETSIANAKNKIYSLKEVIVMPNVGHGIETYKKAVAAIGEKIEELV